jgi:hypothetical protein
MKKLVTIILTLIIAECVFSQNKENIKAIADSAVKLYTWDIQRSEKGAMMFLDIPFTRENSNSTEYVTITIAKAKSKNRPDFISIIVPKNVLQSNGIFIKFANTITSINGDRTIELEKGNPARVNFEKCNDQDCTARIIDGYVFDTDTNQKEDIFQKLLKFDHLLLLIVYPDKSHKSMMVPLFSFKAQYKSL